MRTPWRTPATLVATLLLTSAVPATALAAGGVTAAPVLAGTVAVNEVDVAQDWVELVNTGTDPVDVSGYVLKDDKDDRTLAVPAGTVLAPGAYLAVDTNTDGDPAGFGLGKADTARLFAPDGVTLLDAYAWTQEPATSWGRCADGTGEFVAQPETTKGAANRCEVSAADVVVVNEVESDGDTSDWIELANTAAVAVDLSGYVLKDSKETPSITLAPGTTIAAGGYLTVDTSATFGLGGDDSARLVAPDGTVVDAYSWTEHATTTYGRCADAVGEFTTTATPTKGAANDCAPPAAAGALVINEVESSGDDSDWIELMNTGSTPIDLSGYVIKDDDDGRTDRIDAGTVIAPGAFLVLEGESATDPDFLFGLGAADEARIFLPDGATLVASYAWTSHATVTYGRCPDGTGEFTTTSVSTKGLPNDCRVPVRINEVESSGGTPGDWVELVNVGVEPVDLSGYLFGDADDTHRYPLPAGTTITPGAYLVLDEADFGFGLGGGDSARLLTPDGGVVDEYGWTAHAATTYGRCPDGTGEFATTTEPTKGARNECEGIITPETWPGGADVRTLDDEGTYAGDMSGIDYEPSGTSAPGTLWAVQNGDGLLYRIVPDGADGWAPDTTGGWAAGKTLAYPAETGQAGSVVDAEGVTLVADDPANGVYVSSERDGGAASGVSRPSVLRYDVTGGSGTTLVATHEWNLAAHFPGLGANAGLEGITWVPDTFLVAQGFVDATTGGVYQPSRYPGHGDGLFFVGVEGTAAVYAYALLEDGGFARVATIETDFALVADVQFDADRAALWIVCDEACDGRIALAEIGDDGAFATTHVYDRPAGSANYANEGFALAPQAECVAGTVATFYVDDAATDGHSLRGGTLSCDPTDPGTDPTDPGTDPTDPGTDPTDPGTGPTDPGTPGTPGTGGGTTPTPVADGAMTDATRGDVRAPSSAAPGATLVLTVGTQYAGQTVDVWLHSTPIHLGRVVVAADGTVRVTLPADVPAGAHRIAVVAADGTLLGWDEITVTGAGGARAATAGRLATTGAQAGGAAAAGLALVLVGAALVVTRRLRRAAA